MELSDLLAGGPVVTDGAWGTELQRRGLAAGESADLWNLIHPDRVFEVAADYVAAGSQVILTNTFQASSLCLAGHGHGREAAEINRAGAAISRKAAPQAKVFASIGPSGKLLMMGDCTPEEMLRSFREQAGALAAGGADALLIETMSDLEEARIALEAAKSTGLPVVVSFAFDSGKHRDRTMMGASPEQAAKAMADAGADAVGANCGAGVEHFLPVCRRMKDATSLPLWMKPNAGLPVVEHGSTVYRATPQEFAARSAELVEAGASFIGGCCGTSPAFIRAVSLELAGQPHA